MPMLAPSSDQNDGESQTIMPEYMTADLQNQAVILDRMVKELPTQPPS